MAHDVCGSEADRIVTRNENGDALMLWGKKHWMMSGIASALGITHHTRISGLLFVATGIDRPPKEHCTIQTD